MWLRKIKYKKLQYLLMAIILAASAMIFFSSVAYVQEVNAFVGNFYSAKNMPEVFVTAKSGAYERITNDESLMKNFESIYFYEGKTNPELVRLNGKTHTGRYTVFPITNKNELCFKMEFKDTSNNAIAPKPGEVWISYTYADQNDIKIGDTLTLGDKGTYTVAALTVSATTSTVFSAFTPYYISQSDYIKFDSAQDYEMILINSNSDFGASNTINSLANSISGLLDTAFTRVSVAQTDSSTTNITGNIGIIASLIMFAAALFITTYIIKNNLQKELKAIGIYKSLGFSNNKIKGIYFKGYLLTAVIAASFGVLAGIPLIYAMSMPAVKYLGNFSITSITAVCGIIAIAVLSAITALSLALVLQKIGKIKPVETLNMGLRSSTKKLKKSVIKSARSPFSLAINEIFKYSGASIMAVIMIAIALFVSYTFGGVGHSMSYLDKKIGPYFAFPEGDIYIMENNSLYEDMLQKQEVSSVVKAKAYYSNIAINDTSLGMNIFILDNFDSKLTGIHTAKAENLAPIQRWDLISIFLTSAD